MPGITISVPVTRDGANLTAPDITIPDVGTGNTVVITWFPEDVELHSISGLPQAVRLSGPTPTGELIGTYFAPTSDITWSYTIHGAVEGVLVKHDPQIHNTTPT
jgi:hypothetical protein